jgi:hypothetical protein
VENIIINTKDGKIIKDLQDLLNLYIYDALNDVDVSLKYQTTNLLFKTLIQDIRNQLFVKEKYNNFQIVENFTDKRFNNIINTYLITYYSRTHPQITNIKEGDIEFIF